MKEHLGGGTHKKGHDLRRVLFCDKVPQYRYFKFSIGYLEDHPTGLLAGGAFAPYKRFRRRRKPWPRANSFRPSILNQRVEPPSGRQNPKRKTSAKQMSFFLVRLTGVEWGFLPFTTFHHLPQSLTAQRTRCFLIVFPSIVSHDFSQKQRTNNGQNHHVKPHIFNRRQSKEGEPLSNA